MLSQLTCPALWIPPEVIGTDPDDPEKEIIRKVDPSSPLTALAFKIATDPYVGRLCFFRVYAGELPAGSYVYNSRSGKKERISRLFQMHSNKENPVEEAHAGHIYALIGLKDVTTGDTLCAQDSPIILESIDLPGPGHPTWPSSPRPRVTRRRCPPLSRSFPLRTPPSPFR